MKKTTLILISASMSFSVLAKPVYFECKVKDKQGESKEFSVSLNEATGKALHSEQGSGNPPFTFTSDAFFTEDKVTYKKVINTGIKISRIFEISRIDLSALEIFEIEGVRETSRSYSKGKCKIKEPVNNLF